MNAADDLDPAALDATLRTAFGGTDAERRVVVRQAVDLADSGKHDADRGFALTSDDVIEQLGDAPEACSIAERWNWWLGALDVAYGGYREFQVQAVERE